MRDPNMMPIEMHWCAVEKLAEEEPKETDLWEPTID